MTQYYFDFEGADPDDMGLDFSSEDEAIDAACRALAEGARDVSTCGTSGSVVIRDAQNVPILKVELEMEVRRLAR